MRAPAYIGVLLAIVRHYVNDQVIAVIKRAIIEWQEAAEDGWQENERTNFVIAKATEAAAATPTPIDDVLVWVAAKLYVAKYVAEGKAAPAPGA